MKAQILKIAGVKSEKEFYKKYKTEADFMKVHGKAFKKAQMGTVISGGDKMSNPKMINFQNLYDESDIDVTGMTDEMRQKQAAALQAKQAPAPSEGGGGGMSNILGSLSGMLGGGASGSTGGNGGGMSEIASSLARYGADVPRAQYGGNYPAPIDSSFQGSPGYQQQQNNSWYQNNPPGGSINYKQNNNVGSQINNNLVSLTDEEVANKNGKYNGYSDPAGPNAGGEGIMDTIAKKAGPVGQLYGSYQALRGERRARKAAEQQKAVSDITLKASQTRPEEIKRKYVRPEDIQNTGEEFFPIYGVGTNPLARNGIRLQDGGGIGGNPTEIQNTYNDGYDIYTDGGYEPLNDSDVKQYYHGGRIHQMQNGGGTPWGQIGEVGSQVAGQASGGPNAGGDIGGQLGGTLGEAAGNAIAPGIGGPIGKAIGQVGGTLAGGFLDTNPKSIKRNQAATKRNIQMMALNSGFQGIQGQNQSYVRNGGDIPNYEDGGYMNPEYNPQVITMFGDHNAQDFADYAHKDQYRAGGHLKSYTPPSERAMETYEDGGGVKSYGLGGELQTHWGGGAETLSHNPYLPGTGETVMFRGKSHEEYSPNGETGIGVTYGGNPVEVERGEPMVELEEGGTVDPQTGEVQKSGVVFGNLKIPDSYLAMLGDKNAKGKKFKNYVADLSKGEAKQNKLIEKSTNELDGFTPITPFDKLKMTALQANIQGANMKLKDIADKKINAAALQNAINDTAEEHGIVADDLARGKVKIDKEAMKSREARWGDAIEKAAGGKTVTTETTKKPTREEAIARGFEVDPTTGKGKKLKKAAVAPTEKTIITPGKEGTGGISGTKGKKYVPNENAWWKSLTPAQKAAHNAKVRKMIATDPEYKDVPAVEAIGAIPETKEVIKTPGTPAEYEEIETEEPSGKFPWEGYANQLINYLRPSDQEALDMEQLYPEMYAMSSNQLEPVPAQGFQPDLGVPYDISLQDQLNANQADYRATQRMVGYNPAAQANLNAQKYQANQQVLGNQFRANQEMKDKVYGENRNILNQAKLTNLNIYDKQYDRQSQALSNTKATTQAALNSISDKYAKNKLENKTLGVMENMYNYRFDDSGRAVNMNPLAQFNWKGRETSNKSSGKGLAEGKGFTYDENGNIVGVRSVGKEDTGKNGKKISAKNGSIVKSYKNI